LDQEEMKTLIHDLRRKFKMNKKTKAKQSEFEKQRERIRNSALQEHLPKDLANKIVAY